MQGVITDHHIWWMVLPTCLMCMLQVGTEQVTKTIEGYIMAATVAEGGINKAMKVIWQYSSCYHTVCKHVHVDSCQLLLMVV